ncbi:GNAT family N-acetyltransferase [Halobacillus salinarum]|uniref:GNAT family N-acetyltransferase n=1 Tax=Halobacillus salinarum TaxID=2932257 RepID=UPI0037C03C86
METEDYELIAVLNKPVHDLHHSLYPDFFQEYNLEAVKELFRKQMDKVNAEFLILEDEEETVGFAWVETRKYDRYPYKKSFQSLYIHQISIDQEKRGRGYGTYLLNHIYQLAEDKGVNEVELDYWEKNNQAEQFYNKHGFAKSRQTVFKNLKNS